MTLKVGKLLSISIAQTLLVVSLVGVTTAQAQDRASSSIASLSDWKSYIVRGEEFVVSLPIVPGLTTQTTYVLKLNKYRQQRIISTYADGVVYAIYAFENPKRRQSLDELIAEMYRDSKERAPRNLTLGGFSGKEYEFQTGDRKGVSQFYMTDRHIYLFEVIGSKLGNPDVAIPKFLSSIRLGKTPEGIEIVDGPGEQPNSDPTNRNENSEVRALTGKEVTSKAIVITKPEPSYTDAARKNQLTGTVVLRCIFRASGAVTDLREVSGLPFGLTEKAIAAARQIRFIPAIKNGHFVSMYVQLEYNFNLY